MRKAVLVLALLVMGCDQPQHFSRASGEAAPAPREASMMGGEKREANFAYTHHWSLEMPAASVTPRYERARKLCLEDQNYKCSLLNSQLYQPSDSEQPVSASLVLRLPHDKIPAFEGALLAPLEGETQGDAIITHQRTDGEDLNQPVTDNESRLAQLKDYLERLKTLSGRDGAKVDELIQIERELSQTQAQIEAITAAQRALRDRIDRDTLSLDLQTRRSPQDVIAQQWRHVFDGFHQNAVDMVSFIFNALPWIPIVAVGFLALGLGWRLIRAVQGRKSKELKPKTA